MAFIPFYIPKDNGQRFPGLLLAQVSEYTLQEEGEEELCFLFHLLKGCAACFSFEYADRKKQLCSPRKPFTLHSL